MKKTKRPAGKSRDPRRKVSKKTKAKRRSRAVRHARKMSALRGRRKSKKKRVILIGTSYACKQQADLDRSRGGSLYGRKGVEIMKKKRSVMPWFRKGSKSRKGRRLHGFDGAIGGAGIGGVIKNGAVTVGGAALGSVLAARVPLPANLVNFRGLVPVVAGVALGASKWGRKGIGSYLALGMIVSGGLALGRQYAPQVFAGEDEMLGLPALDESAPLGLEYQSGGENDIAGLEYQSGEGVEDVELFGEFATSADM